MRYHKETEKELQQKKRETKKNDSPSPTGYKNVLGGFEKLSGSPSNDRGGRYYKIAKGERRTMFDQIIKNQKKLPGVGKYQSHVALDKVARPMRPAKH